MSSRIRLPPLPLHSQLPILRVKSCNVIFCTLSFTALIGSINYGMMFLNGPIAAALAAKYGCRATSMVGSAIFSLGFLLSSYAQHIVTLYFTYGVMVGFGASLCYFSSLVAVGQYFYNKLSLANGIISSGSGIGSLVMGPVMNNLLKHLGWRDTLRVYAGMAALIFMSAILYRHINTSGVQQDDGAKSKEKPEKAKFIDFTIFNNKAYIIWCVALSIYILGYFVPFVHLVSSSFILYWYRKAAKIFLITYFAMSTMPHFLISFILPSILLRCLLPSSFLIFSSEKLPCMIHPIMLVSPPPVPQHSASPPPPPPPIVQSLHFVFQLPWYFHFTFYSCP